MTTGAIYLDYNTRPNSELAYNSVADETYRLLEVREVGIAYAINYGLNFFFEEAKVDNVVICANDIIMPKGWLFWMEDALKYIQNTGAIAIHTVEKLPDVEVVNNYRIRPSWGVFGNTLITRAAFERVGYFNEDHDPYGMQDSDYCYRLHKAGFINYYLADLSAQHIGHDVGENTPYRKMKDDGLAVAGQKFNQWQKIYDAGHLYLPYDQSIEIIKQTQFLGE